MDTESHPIRLRTAYILAAFSEFVNPLVMKPPRFFELQKIRFSQGETDEWVVEMKRAGS